MLKSVIVTASALGLTACAVAPPSHLTRAADPAAPSAYVHHPRVTAGTAAFRPVEPLDWGEVNRRVGPQEERP